MAFPYRHLCPEPVSANALAACPQESEKPTVMRDAAPSRPEPDRIDGPVEAAHDLRMLAVGRYTPCATQATESFFLSFSHLTLAS